MEVESASGIVLVICTIVALVLANSPAAHGFHELWEIHFRVGVAGFTLDKPLHFWINDALMTLFFFVVGLEIKRELVAGELSSVQKAALPVVAAFGGMVAPACVYLLLHPGGESHRGWGIPMATDIAFVVGLLAVFGPRVPFGLKIFLLALAIVDDIGAILVIAVAYSGSPNLIALGLAAAGFVVTYGLNRLGVRTVGVYVIIGAHIWLAVLLSGVHPTIAGVLLGLLTPGNAWVGQKTLREALAGALHRISDGKEDEADHVAMTHLAFAAKESVSPLERLEALLHPWVGFLIMPLFALANAGVAIQVSKITDPVAIAVACGLMAGKPIGIFLFCFASVKLGLCQLPTGVNWRMLFAAGCLGGIGFTMSLFIAGLALPPSLLDAGKVGIFAGSLISAILGSVLLLLALRKRA